MSDYDPAFPGMLNCANLRYTDVDTLSTEQKLFDSYWQELINMYGVGLAWQVHRYDKTQADNLYGEHINQPYADPVEILGLVDLQENAVALSKYGFVTDDTIKLYLHIKSYTDTFEPLGIYQGCNQKYIAPKAGDIFTLYEFGKTRPLGLGGKMFEVTDRTDQDVGMNINQLAGHYVWVINAKRYDASYEPNVEEERESYQIFDDDYTGRIVDNTEVRELPSEQKAYEYSAEEDTMKNVLDYRVNGIDTSMYGGYLKLFSKNAIDKLTWYATTENINVYTQQPTTEPTDGKYFQCTLVPEVGFEKQGIRIPSFYTLVKVESFNTITNTWYVLRGKDILSTKLFNTIQVPILYDGECYDYTQYTYNGPTVGARDMKFYVEAVSSIQPTDEDVTKMKWYATIKGDGSMSQMDTPDFNDNQACFECTLVSEKDGIKQAIQIPYECTVTHIEIFNTFSQKWEIIGNNAEYSLSLFDKDEVMLQIDGEYFKYTQYTYNGPTIGSRQTRFYATYKDQSTNIPPSLLDTLPWFATSNNIKVFTKQSDDQFNSEYFECELQAENDTFRQTIQIPAVYNIVKIEQYTTANKWSNMIDGELINFGVETITKNIDTKQYSYKQLTRTGKLSEACFMRFHVKL